MKLNVGNQIPFRSAECFPIFILGHDNNNNNDNIFLNHYLENVNAHGLCIDVKGQIFLTHIFSSTFFLHNKNWKKGFGVFFPFHNAPMLFSSISASVMLFFTENSFMDEIFITNYS